MSLEQHNAEMLMLHSNQMAGASRYKSRIKILNIKLSELIQKSGGIEKMNEGQARNYEFILETIADLEIDHQSQQAIFHKYQSLYNKQAELIKKIFVPSFKMKFFNHIVSNIEQFITTELKLEMLNGVISGVEYITEGIGVEAEKEIKQPEFNKENI